MRRGRGWVRSAGGSVPRHRFAKETTLLGLEVVVVLGLAVLGSSVLGARLRIAPPILMLACGIVLGFVPALRGVALPPEVMLLLFLPALLYWESLTSSLREIRNNLRVIVMASVGLVIATAGIVAVIAHVCGLAWGPAWVLGAAVAPTDATAIGIVARMLPRRTLTVLRTESLVNDGTALVIYGIAVGVTAGSDHFDSVHVGWLFLLAYAGGAAAGLLTAWLAVQARRHLDSPLHENLVSILTPFAAFLLAEAIHASGVLAVVVCGLTLGQYGPRLVRADTRQQAQAFWGLSTFVLNGSLFVLVGLQVQAAVHGLGSAGLPTAIWTTVLVSLGVVGARFAWLFTTPYVIRALDRRPAQRLRRVGPRPRVVNAMSGFRGAVSLAAALAIPETTASGAPFPGREVIVFVVTGVIVVTLVVQGLAIPAVVRWARIPADTDVEAERRLAETVASEEAYASIRETAERLGTVDAVVLRTIEEYQHHLAILRSGVSLMQTIRGAAPGASDLVEDAVEEPELDPLIREEHDYRELRLELLAHKRATVIRLRDERRIDDTVLRQIQGKLDVEEVRLSRREAVE